MLCATHTTLQVRDAAEGQAGLLRQVFLRQPGRDAMLPQDVLRSSIS